MKKSKVSPLPWKHEYDKKARISYILDANNVVVVGWIYRWTLNKADYDVDFANHAMIVQLVYDNWVKQ